MGVLARRIERALIVSVQRAQDADACDHGWPTAFSYEDQGFHSSLPFRRVVLGFRKLGDVVGRVFQRDERLSVWQRDRFVEGC